MPKTHQPQENQILSALLIEERERLFPHLQRVEMPLGTVLYESGDTLRHLYFPTDCIVSLLYVLEDGASAEIAVVGKEGAIGVALFMPRTALVTPVFATRLQAWPSQRRISASPPAQASFPAFDQPAYRAPLVGDATSLQA